MKKKVAYIIYTILLTATFLSACIQSPPRTESPYMVNTFDKASIELADESPTAESITFTIAYSGDSCGLTSDWYVIEELIDGKWYSIPYCSDCDAFFNDITYQIENDTPKKIDENWSIYYGKLAPGIYRLIKELYNYTSLETSTKYYLALEFEITN